MGNENPNLRSVKSYPLPPSSYPLPLGLYIHIPFCLSKCPYCGFYSETKTERIDAFMGALLKEINLVSNRLPGPSPKRESAESPPSPGERIGAASELPMSFDTIYFGGGTPSLLSLAQLENIFNFIRKYLSITHYNEITFEINPGDGNLEYFRGLSSLGINRLNLGVQSFDGRVLNFLGRRHSADQARESVDLVRKSGFKNLGLDLIYGIPGQSLASWIETLTKAAAFFPEHLSCYELTLEENTPFARKAEEGCLPLPGEEAQREFFLRTSEFLESEGYIHYEVSNFARGEECSSRHNQKYWDHTPYLGLGPGAHSFNGIRRWWNHRSVEEYIAALAAGTLPVDSFEDLTAEQRMLEEIYFGMRTRKGIDLEKFRREFQVDLEVEKEKILSLLEKEGLITIRKGILSPTRAGLAVADRLALI